MGCCNPTNTEDKGIGGLNQLAIGSDEVSNETLELALNQM
jgi:hypothetical protein